MSIGGATTYTVSIFMPGPRSDLALFLCGLSSHAGKGVVIKAIQRPDDLAFRGLVYYLHDCSQANQYTALVCRDCEPEFIEIQKYCI